MNKRGQFGKTFLLIIGIIALFVGIYFTFFFSYSCDDIACFRAHQQKCSRTEFINDAEDTTWFYKILGEENKACEIKVKVIQVKKGDISKRKLEGKSMNCYLPLGDTSSPEADIESCHGLLKEELQNIIIEKLHLYVIENIGEIGEELKKAV